MRLYTLPDARTLRHGEPFELADVKYPPNWLELATPQDLAERGIGVTEIPDPVAPPLSLAEQRQRAIDAVLAAGEARRVSLTTPYPSKREVYQLKAEIAINARKSDEEVPTAELQQVRETARAVLAMEAAERGMTWEELAALIIARRDTWAYWAMQIATVEAAAQRVLSAAAAQDLDALRDGYIATIAQVGPS